VIYPAIGLSCHRHLADTSAKLDAGVEASGPHDFTVRESAVRLRAWVSLTGKSPPSDPHRAPTLPRPPHPAPTFVTMANAPQWVGTAGVMDLIWENREAKYFC